MLTEGSEVVVGLIRSLYNPSTPPDRHAQIQVELQKIQTDPGIWNLLASLMEYQGEDSQHVCFLAASLLHQKIVNDWASLDDAQREALRQSLLVWLHAAAVSNNRSLLLKISAALTSLVAHVEAVWDTWINDALTAAGDPTAVLTVLAVLLEEVPRLSLVGPKRTQFVAKLRNNAPLLVTVISSALTGAPWDGDIIETDRRNGSGQSQEHLRALGRAMLSRDDDTPSASPSTPLSPSRKPSGYLGAVHFTRERATADTVTALTALSCFAALLRAGHVDRPAIWALYPLVMAYLTREDTAAAAASVVADLIDESRGVDATGFALTNVFGRAALVALLRYWVATPAVGSILAAATSALCVDPRDEDAMNDTDVDPLHMAVIRLVCVLGESVAEEGPALGYDRLDAGWSDGDHSEEGGVWAPTGLIEETSSVPPFSIRQSYVQQLFMYCAQLAGIPSYHPTTFQLSEMTLSVWVVLSEECVDTGRVCGGSQGALVEGSKPPSEETRLVWQLLETLEQGVRSKVQWPADDIVRSWSKDTTDAFIVFRATTAQEILENIQYVLRRPLLERWVQTVQAQSLAGNWLELEATLFCLCTVHQAISKSDIKPFLGDMFRHLLRVNPTPATASSDAAPRTMVDPVTGLTVPVPQQPDAIGRLQNTILRLVGLYGTWLDLLSSEERAALLVDLVSFIVRAFGVRDACSEAARALRLLCDKNRRALVGHVGSFVSVLVELEGQIPPEELTRVLESVCSVIEAMPPDQMPAPLLSFVRPLTDKLRGLLNAPNSLAPVPAPDVPPVAQQLVYLTACARGLRTLDQKYLMMRVQAGGPARETDVILEEDEGDTSDEAVFGRVQQLRHVLQSPEIRQLRIDIGQCLATIAEQTADSEFVQAVSDYIRASSLDIFPSALSLDAISLYRLCMGSAAASLSPVWLSLGGALIRRLIQTQAEVAGSGEYSSNSAYVASTLPSTSVAYAAEAMRPVLTRVLLEMDTLQAMIENPDVVQGFYQLCSETITHYPRLFLYLEPELDEIMYFTERGLGIHEPFALKASIDLLTLVAQQTKLAPGEACQTMYEQHLLRHLPSILESIIVSIAGAVPRSSLSALGDVLHSLILRLPGHVGALLRQLLLERRAFPNELATDAAKQKFCRIVAAARSSRQIRSAVSDFALVCRGLDGTEYAAASRGVF